MSKRFEELVLEQFNILNGKVDGLGVRMDHLESRMERIESRMDVLEHRMDALEQRVSNIEQRLVLLEKRIGRIEQKIDALDSRLSNLEQTFSRFNKDFTMASGYVSRELLVLTDISESLRTQYNKHDDRLTRNEETSKVLSNFVGYSEDTGSFVAKDSDSFASLYQKNHKLSRKEREFLLTQRILGKLD